MNTTEPRTTISTLPEDPRKHLRMIIVDYSENMEPYGTLVHETLLNAMLAKPAHESVALTVYQGDYLECYHEDHLKIRMLDSMPTHTKCGGASRAITHVLQSLLRRNEKSKYPLQVNILYIGGGLDTAEDLMIASRRDQAIREALALLWTFDLIPFIQSTRQCWQSTGFDAASNLFSHHEAVTYREATTYRESAVHRDL